MRENLVTTRLTVTDDGSSQQQVGGWESHPHDAATSVADTEPGTIDTVPRQQGSLPWGAEGISVSSLTLSPFDGNTAEF